MDSTLKEEKGCQRIFSVNCPWEEVEPTWKTVVKAVRNQAKFDGFRPGKAPEAMVKSKFRKEIRDEVLDHFLPTTARQVVEKNNLEPVAEPYAASIELEEGTAFLCELTVEVAPLVPPVETHNLQIECHKLEVTPEQIEKTLQNMRERAAMMKPVEGVAEAGDYASVQYRRSGQGKAQEKFFQANGESAHPIEKALLGRKVGDSFEVEIGPAAEGVEAKGAMAAGRYQVEVVRLARRVVPELGDDLAKDLGADSLADLKGKVESGLKAQADAAMKSEQGDHLIEGLLQKHPFPVPPTLAERQLREDLEHFAESLVRQGLDLNKAPIEWDKVASSMRPGAERKVQAYYLLEAITASEKIEISESELEMALEARAKSGGVPLAQLRARYAKEGLLDSLRKSLAHAKAVELLLSRASVTFVAAPPAAPGGPDAIDSDGGGTDEPR